MLVAAVKIQKSAYFTAGFGFAGGIFAVLEQVFADCPLVDALRDSSPAEKII